MLKRLIIACLAVGGAASLAVAADATTTATKTTRVNLSIAAPKDAKFGSFARIRQFSTIRADVVLIDTGTSLSVNGQGSGFNPTLAYTSFFYGTGSVSKGSLACIPPTPNNLTVPQMITAYWLPVGSSTRTLTVTQTGASYAPLAQLGTMSVRYDSTPTLPLSVNLNPGRFWLNSCGSIQALND